MFNFKLSNWAYKIMIEYKYISQTCCCVQVSLGKHEMLDNQGCDQTEGVKAPKQDAGSTACLHVAH